MISHKIGLNLIDFRVCWHKMSTTNCLDYVYYKNCDYTDDTCSTLDLSDFSTLVIKENTLKKDFHEELTKLLDSKYEDDPVIVTVNHNIDEKLMNRINLYNKYCDSKAHELKYDAQQDGSIKIEGSMKVYWNLMTPIQLETRCVTPLDYQSDKLKNKKSDKYSFDDNALNFDKITNLKNITRSNTVSYKHKKERNTILNREQITKQDQFFIPAYSSVSSIHIDDKTTCEQAIKILLDKYQILNSPSDYSLYKLPQTGTKVEFKGDDLLLINRLWMGPFNEDKIVIMEKGISLNNGEHLDNFISLPMNFLNCLIDNLNKEELSEIEKVKNSYISYRNLLLSKLRIDESVEYV